MPQTSWSRLHSASVSVVYPGAVKGAGMNNEQKTPIVETHRFAENGTVPNSRLPLVVYRGALPDDGDRAAACEQMFARNGWPDSWRNGIYPFHHYHSTAH
jgi:hypothetical protein